MATLPQVGKVLPEEDEQGRAAAHPQPDMLLIRASFVGDLFLDPFFLFMPVPDRHAVNLKTLPQPPWQIPIALPVRPAAEGQTERQPEGQMAQAAGPVRPTVRKQVAEPLVGPSNPAKRQPPISDRQANHVTGLGQKAATPSNGQRHKAAPDGQLPVGATQHGALLEPAPPDSKAGQEPACMLRNLDIRQNITSRAALQ